MPAARWAMTSGQERHARRSGSSIDPVCQRRGSAREPQDERRRDQERTLGKDLQRVERP